MASQRNDLDARDRHFCQPHAQCALMHVQRLAFARAVGTAGEARAQAYISQAMSALGLHVVQEPFPICVWQSELLTRAVYLLCAVLALAAGLLTSLERTSLLWVSGFLWLLAALLVNRPFLLTRLFSPCQRFMIWSHNIVGTRRCQSQPIARVIFMAHYDTKSQYLPTGIRVALVTTATICSALLGVVAWLACLGVPLNLQSRATWQLVTLTCVCLASLIANVTRNHSPGVLDNGSGVGLLLELARCFRPPDTVPAEVCFVATSAEEIGLQGARAFLLSRRDWLRQVPTLIINLESVGAGKRIFLAGSPVGVKLAEEVAADLELRCARLHVLGARMDHEPFVPAGFLALSLLGDVVRYSMHMHTHRDNLSILQPQTLERIGRLACALAWRWLACHAENTAEHAVRTRPSCLPQVPVSD